VVARNLLLVAMGVYSTANDAVRKPVEAVPLADPMDGRVRGPDPVVALQVPDDTTRPRSPEVSADLVDVPDSLPVLKDSFLPMDLSFLVGHSDLPGHPLLRG
jgi:hypothetical protein